MKNNGTIIINTPVKEILIEDNKAIGVKTTKGDLYRSNWVISNVDYKRTFCDLINPIFIKKNYLEIIKKSEYTGSEFCVYLGVETKKLNLNNFKAEHVFYRSKIESKASNDPEDFEDKEIEICLWSNKAINSAPKGKMNILLRVNMPYDYFINWRISEKKRKEGYKEYKKNLAQKLINVVEEIIPGLSDAIELIEIATPLTYLDWGQRFRGSVAGWSRDAKKVEELKKFLLIKTPIENLLMAGIYAVKEPFLGGYPVSMYTGKLAAELILSEFNKL